MNLRTNITVILGKLHSKDATDLHIMILLNIKGNFYYTLIEICNTFDNFYTSLVLRPRQLKFIFNNNVF